MRLVILGCAGAGTTTLAKRLSERTGARLICLDDLSSTSGVSPDQIPAFRKLMTELHAAEAWISEPPAHRVAPDAARAGDAGRSPAHLARDRGVRACP